MPTFVRSPFFVAPAALLFSLVFGTLPEFSRKTAVPGRFTANLDDFPIAPNLGSASSWTLISPRVPRCACRNARVRTRMRETLVARPSTCCALQLFRAYCQLTVRTPSRRARPERCTETLGFLEIFARAGDGCVRRGQRTRRALRVTYFRRGERGSCI